GSKTPESTPCPPPEQTTRHNNDEHVAYFSPSLLAYFSTGVNSGDCDASAGVPLAVIAKWLGHSDASITARIYAHSQDDELRAAGQSLGAVLTSS
ncbi:MAG: hypothetical protein AB7G47_22190, partial [Mycolicibacterium sp.]